MEHQPLRLLAHLPKHHSSVSFSDAGFENYTVLSGGFVQHVSGPWVFTNDAGVVEPFAPNSSTGPFRTWSATFDPIEGQQYASTYAGGDSISQAVSFGTDGDYRIVAYAAAPSGSFVIPPDSGIRTLVDGQFTFKLGSRAIGSVHTVPLDSDWTQFTANFSITTPGRYELGISNLKIAPYFINYDAFSIQAVPEPSTLALGLLGVLGHASCSRRRRNHHKNTNITPG